MKREHQKVEVDGDREVFSSPSEKSLSSSKKIYPKEGDRKRSLVKTKGVIAGVVCICQAWTIWLILLNVSPNRTVNRVMRTETFDYGSFWLFIDPSKTLVAIAALGLSIVASGYLSVLIRMMFCTRKSTKLQPTSKINILSKVGSSLHGAIANSSRNRVASTTIALAVSFSRPASATSKLVKLGVKFVDLALEVLLLHQMLESGSPVVLIAIFTFIVVSNALSCAVMMFIPYERAPLAEIFVDILFDFLIAVGFPMLVVFYCLSTFSFDRAKLAINLEVFPRGWFEQDALVIADPAETEIIYQTLKTLRIMSVLNLFTRIGVNFTLCFRLWQVVDLIQCPSKLQSSIHPKRSRFAAVFLVVFSILLVIFVEESVRTSSQACRPHPQGSHYYNLITTRRYITESNAKQIYVAG